MSSQSAYPSLALGTGGSERVSKESPAQEPAASSGGSKESKLPLILALVNTLAIVAVIGLAVYTRLVFKKPKITEKAERARLEAIKASPSPPPVSGLIEFKQVTLNIAPSGPAPKNEPGEPSTFKGKLHYLTIAFALEIKDMKQQALIEELRPRIMDRILALLGRKAFQELSTVQGRYILRTQIIDITNDLILTSEDPPSPSDPSGNAGAESHKNALVKLREPLVTNVFFTQFIAQ